MRKNNAVCNYDFTLWDKDKLLEVGRIKTDLDAIAKKWCFQGEDAGSGLHYQGRFSLKVKKRISEFTFLHAHLSKTSTENMDNMFYVMKDETRVSGPWRDTDMYIPRQVREITLYPWQLEIERDIGVWNTRNINIVVDTNGNCGKSILTTFLCTTRSDVKSVPALNNYKDIMALVMCMPVAKMYIVDMPRGIDKFHQAEFFAAIESLKDGHAFDTRYSFKEKYFDCPNIWVFTNVKPDFSLLSSDRWHMFTIVNNDLRRTNVL